jgi:hypothetical protein
MDGVTISRPPAPAALADAYGPLFDRAWLAAITPTSTAHPLRRQRSSFLARLVPLRLRLTREVLPRV